MLGGLLAIVETVDGDHCRAFVKLLANLMDFAIDVLDVARPAQAAVQPGGRSRCMA
jgi:hypothetical protein